MSTPDLATPDQAAPHAGSITTIRTITGSRYTVRASADGRFWLSGDNRVSPTSVPIQDGEWEITRPTPWPPILGEGLYLPSAFVEQAPGSLGRIPGGGKFTSPVVGADTRPHD